MGFVFYFKYFVVDGYVVIVEMFEVVGVVFYCKINVFQIFFVCIDFKGQIFFFSY